MLHVSKIQMIILIVTALIIMMIIIKMKMEQSRKKELRMIAQDKLRDQALNNALANHLYGPAENETKIESLPYEVDYNQRQLEHRLNKQDKIMLQLTACSELSKRKFMIELKESVRIGRGKENTIVIKDTRALPVHCEIFRYHNGVYLKNLNDSKTILNRKRQKVYVDYKGLKLKTGDKIIIENTTIEVIIIDKME